MVLFPSPSFSDCDDNDDACLVTIRTSARWDTIPTRVAKVGTEAEAELFIILLLPELVIRGDNNREDNSTTETVNVVIMVVSTKAQQEPIIKQNTKMRWHLLWYFYHIFPAIVTMTTMMMMPLRL